MIDLEFVERLIKAIDESGLDSLEIERGGTRVRLSKSPPPPPIVAGPSMDSAAEAEGAPENVGSVESPDAMGEPETGEAVRRENLVDVASPMVGTFYRAPAPDAPPYVESGSTVAAGDTLCIIEAMKLMNELEAETSGTVREILAENAEPVEYGQVLFRIEPA